MPKHVLIGVGGSGQHVVHAYLRELALSFPEPERVPHVFILDADAVVGRGESKKSTLIDDIFDLHQFLVNGDATPAHCAVLKPYRVPREGEVESDVVGRLIGIEGNEALEPLASAFLADDAHAFGNDRKITLTEGMMANPKIGALAIAHKFRFQEADQWGALFQVLRPDVRVAIVGSNFGGTGSGVIPALVRRLDSRAQSVRAFMCLPWFSIEAGAAGTRSAAAAEATWDPKARNASLGLHAYKDELFGTGARAGQLNRSAYVLTQSMSAWAPAQRGDAGNWDQPEHRHVLNLAQAAAIQVFLGMGPAHGQVTGLFALTTSGALEPQGNFEAGKSAHLRFWVGPDDSRQLSDLAVEAEATAFVLEKSGRVIAEAKGGVLELRGVGKLDNTEEIEAFVGAVSDAMGMQRAKRASGLTGMFSKARMVAPDDVYRKLGESMQEIARWMRSSLVWLDGHSTPRATDDSKVARVTGLHAAHLFDVADYAQPRSAQTQIDDDARLGGPWRALQLQVSNVHGGSVAEAAPRQQAFALFDVMLKRPAQPGEPAPVEALIRAFGQEMQHSQAQSQLVVAARVLARAIHRQVMEAHAGARAAENRLDSQQRVTPPGTLPMLSLSGVNPLPASDSRLTALQVRDSAVGNADPFDPNYRLSLAYLDPYLDVPIENGGRLSFEKHVFIEHGLKGIPNVAAPLLLQRWRLAQCLPQAAEDRRSPAYVEDEGRFKPTRAGIFLHAQRINEAALWLLVTADPRVSFVPDLFAAPSPTDHFVALVREELKLREGETLPAIVFSAAQPAIGALREGPRDPNQGKPLFLWGGDTWYLAANAFAREFFARLIADLPSVRHSFSQTNPLRRLPQPDGKRAKSLDAFFSRQVADAVAKLESAMGHAMEAAAHPAKLLMESLALLLEDLPPPVDSLNPDHLQAPTRLWLRNEGVDDMALELFPHRLVATLQEFFTEQIVFVNRDRVPNGLLPIKGEAWDYLEGGSKENRIHATQMSPKLPGTNILARSKVTKLELNLKGIGPVIQELPFGDAPVATIDQELDWSFGIWPNFRTTKPDVPGWEYYVVSGNTRVDDVEAVEGKHKRNMQRAVDLPFLNPGSKVELVVRGRRGRPGSPLIELGRITDGLPRRIIGRPEVLELHSDGQVLGSRRIELSDASGERTAAMLGIDFGTSNTCVAIQKEGNNADSRVTVPLLPGGLFEQNPTQPLLRFMDSGLPEQEDMSLLQRPAASDDARRAQNQLKDFLLNEAAFFHVANATVINTPGETLPSELLVTMHNKKWNEKRQQRQFDEQRVYTQDDEPFGGISGGERLRIEGLPMAAPLFNPLPPEPNGQDDSQLFEWLRSKLQYSVRRHYGDLKWPLGPTDDEIRHSRALRALYIEQTLVVAFAVLRQQGYSGFTELVATLPESLGQVDNRFADNYAIDLRNVVDRLCQATGMRWTPSTNSGRQVRAVSETEAALNSNNDLRAKENSVLTIDIGGGTTDVGVALRYGGRVSSEHRHTTSARFAGNRLLKAVASLGTVRNFAWNGVAPREPLPPEAVTAMLKAHLRRHGHWKGRNATTQRLAHMFFDAIFEYAFKVLHQFMQVHPDWIEQFRADPNQSFQLAMFGNGFKLFDAFIVEDPRQSLRVYLEAMRKRLVGSGLLPADLEKRLQFRFPDMSKSDLIRVGGMNVVAARRGAGELDTSWMPDQVLLPAGLTRVSGPGADPQAPLAAAAVVTRDRFMQEWLGGGTQPARTGLGMTLARAELPREFPLTYTHWKTAGKEAGMLRAFDAAPRIAPLYIDAGALYLTGDDTVLNSDSYAHLMAEVAREAVQ